MGLSPEKRRFLLRHLGPVRLKEIEACQHDATCSADLARKERALQDLATGVKGKGKDAGKLDPILPYVQMLSGKRPPLSPKAEAEIQQLEQSGDPTCVAVADWLRHGAVQG